MDIVFNCGELQAKGSVPDVLEPPEDNTQDISASVNPANPPPMAISAWQLLQVAAVQVLRTMLMTRGWAILAGWRRMLRTLRQMLDASGTSSDVTVSLLVLLSNVLCYSGFC